MTPIETAVTEMVVYCRKLAEADEDPAYINPFFALNTLRGYAQMEEDGRLIDLTEQGTGTEQAFALFRSDTWDKAAFLAEWAKQISPVSAHSAGTGTETRG